MEARVDQVGGDHYQSEYQHWDWVEDIRLPYLEACATKYVSRWRKKNGLEDLKKADSYVAKILARNRANTSLPHTSLTTKFIRVNIPDPLDAEIVETIAHWSTNEHLYRVRRYLAEMTARHPDGTPKTDSNKHG